MVYLEKGIALNGSTHITSIVCGNKILILNKIYLQAIVLIIVILNYLSKIVNFWHNF